MKRQSGFTAIEAMLLLVITGIIGFTGWYVWQAKVNTSKNYDNAENASQGTTNAQNAKNLKKPTFESSSDTSDVSVYTVKFMELPKDIKEAVLANAPCAKNGNIYSEDGSVNDSSDQSYVDKRAALIRQCMAVALYAFNDNAWQFIGATQDGFSCSTFIKYSVPKKLVEASMPPPVECIDSKGSFVDYQ